MKFKVDRFDAMERLTRLSTFCSPSSLAGNIREKWREGANKSLHFTSHPVQSALLHLTVINCEPRKRLSASFLTSRNMARMRYRIFEISFLPHICYDKLHAKYGILTYSAIRSNQQLIRPMILKSVC